jgi:hypothetical protein
MPGWLLMALAGLAVGVWLAWSSASDTHAGRIVMLAIPTGLLFITVAAAERIISAPFWDWTAVRLAASFALAQGHDIYPSLTEGPTLSYIYGPIFAIAFLPATLSDQPTVAITIAMILQLSYFFVPAFLLFRLVAEPPANRTRSGVLGFCVFALLVLNSRALFYSAFALHADGPAFALLLTSCLPLLQRGVTSTRRLAAVGTLASLAVWCKQPAAPIFVALPIWLWVVEGRRTFARALLVFGATGILVSALMLAGFGVADIFFNMFTLPSMIPWKASPGGPSGLFLRHLAYLALLSGSYLAMTVAGVVLGPGERLPGFAEMGSWLRDRRWPLLLLVGIAMVPMSVLGVVRSGGVPNSLSFTLFFVALAGTVAMADAANRAAGWRASIAKLLLVAIGVGLVARHQAVFDPGMLARGSDHLRRFWDNPQQQAHELLSDRPGEIYFPWNPLAHLMVEDQLYHVEYGVNERRLARIPMTMAQFRAEVPPEMRYLAFQRNRQTEWTRRDYLTEYSIRTEIEGYPDWIIYRPAEDF